MKVGLNLRSETESDWQVVSNPQFNQGLVDAIHSAVELGMTAPGPHDMNDVIEHVSILMGKLNNDEGEFLKAIKNHIDGYYLESNKRLCQRFGIDSGYFFVPKITSKAEMMECIRVECRRRLENPLPIIMNHKKTSALLAEACFKK